MRSFVKLTYFISLISLLASLTSCSEQCNIAGNSSVGSLDGRMLYLRVSRDGMAISDVDSCEVVHGRFSFYSNVDTAMMAMLYMGNETLMPVVLENGDLSVEVDHVGQRVSGGPLNDRLYKFLKKKERLENQQWELDRKCLYMMHEGHSPEEIRRIVSPKMAKLAKEAEDLETDFIVQNFDNPLGAGCFMWLFSQYPMPVMTEQIKRIVKKAPPQFLGNPFVSSYLTRARMNMHFIGSDADAAHPVMGK